MSELENAKHERFAKEYIIDMNGGRAYVRAGYSENGADQSASKLLRNPKIIARIAELTSVVSEKLMSGAEQVLAEIGEIAFHKITGIDIIDGKPVMDAIRVPDKLKALEMLGKHHKLFTEKKEIIVHERIDFSDWSDAEILEYINKYQEKN